MLGQDVDEESAAWLWRLQTAGGDRRAAERELPARLVRIAPAEVRGAAAEEDWHAGSRKTAP